MPRKNYDSVDRIAFDEDDVKAVVERAKDMIEMARQSHAVGACDGLQITVEVVELEAVGPDTLADGDA